MLVEAPSYPSLEVSEPGRTGLRLGQWIPVVHVPFVLGTARDASLVLTEPTLAPRHCELVEEYGRWWIRHLGGAAGTFHLGQSIHDAELMSGDAFEVAEGIIFRFWLSPPVETWNVAMEKSLAQHPDDTSLWMAYGDWLHERGVLLGARMANSSAADRARGLGPLAGAAARGALQVDWWGGLPSRVVLRRLDAARQSPSWRQLLSLMGRAAEFRFVRHLEVYGASFGHGLSEPIAAELLKLFDGRFPLLKATTVSPSEEWTDVLWRPTDGSPAVALTPGQVHQSDGLVVSCVSGCWRVERSGESLVHVNGIAVQEGLLRPGDVVRVEADEYFFEVAAPKMKRVTFGL